MDYSLVATVIALVLGLPAACAAFYSFFESVRQKGRMDVLEAENRRIREENGDLRDSNTEFRDALTYERTERDRERQSNAERIHRLEENINVLQGDLILQFLEAVKQAMTDAFHAVQNQTDRRGN